MRNRFQQFLERYAALVDTAPVEHVVLERGAALLRDLVAHDDWLAAEHAVSDPARYRQYLLHRDPAARFSVVSFVWAPGQATPIHDHRIWGLVGVLRGAETSECFACRPDGSLAASGPPRRVTRGEVVRVTPGALDIHRVANASDRETAVSIHVYGGDIGTIRRATYDLAGRAAPFVSGYSNA